MSDGGYATVGTTGSYGNGSYDLYVVRFDELGNELWHKTFGEEETDYGADLVATSDGGIVIVGEIRRDGDRNAYVVCIDKRGNELWSKTFGGSKFDEGNSIVAMSDGGYVIAGSTTSW